MPAWTSESSDETFPRFFAAAARSRLDFSRSSRVICENKIKFRIYEHCLEAAWVMLDEPEVDLDGAESRERMSLPPRPKDACNAGAKQRDDKIHCGRR